MRIFFDFEFIENGDKHPIIPISIGMIREDGKEYYAEFADVDWTKANDWVLENVKPFLTGEDEPKDEITKEIREFVGENPEFWAYFADYDWVILCQLYGNMTQLPKGWPKYCLDIKQYMYHLNLEEGKIPIENSQEHNALADAQWNKKAFDWLMNYTMENYRNETQ